MAGWPFNTLSFAGLVGQCSVMSSVLTVRVETVSTDSVKSAPESCQFPEPLVSNKTIVAAVAPFLRG